MTSNFYCKCTSWNVIIFCQKEFRTLNCANCMHRIANKLFCHWLSKFILHLRNISLTGLEIYSGKLKAKEFLTNPSFCPFLKDRPMIRSNTLAETIESDMLDSSWPKLRSWNPRGSQRFKQIHNLLSLTEQKDISGHFMNY